MVAIEQVHEARAVVATNLLVQGARLIAFARARGQSMRLAAAIVKPLQDGDVAKALTPFSNGSNLRHLVNRPGVGTSDTQPKAIDLTIAMRSVLRAARHSPYRSPSGHAHRVQSSL